VSRTETSVTVRNGVLTLHMDHNGAWALRHRQGISADLAGRRIRRHYPQLRGREAGQARGEGGSCLHAMTPCRVDSLRWIASRLFPKRYGDKSQDEAPGGRSVGRWSSASLSGHGIYLRVSTDGQKTENQRGNPAACRRLLHGGHEGLLR
jgi:hypothetical protein